MKKINTLDGNINAKMMQKIVITTIDEISNLSISFHPNIRLLNLFIFIRFLISAIDSFIVLPTYRIISHLKVKI